MLEKIANTNNYLAHLCDDIVHRNEAVKNKTRSSESIKRGLRNSDGTGVVAGCTQIGSVMGYTMVDGEREPMEGQLYYAGYSVSDLVKGYIEEDRFGFEEVAYLLLIGELPSAMQLESFKQFLYDNMALPDRFTEDMIMRQPSKDIMNQLGRSVLALYSADNNADDIAIENVITQCSQLIARFPIIIANSYVAKRHYFDDASLHLHRPLPGLSIAENFLRSIRPDQQYTKEEAKLLDLCLCIHAEHGGGNNSSFVCRALTSSGTDTYAAIAGAVSSLKGPKHGGANAKVMAMFAEIKENVKDWKNREEVANYLRLILTKKAGDGSGLVYGMGHAIYTLSDPRAVLLREHARSLAEKTGKMDELELYELVEELTPGVFAEVTGKEKVMCANVDMYSGLIYSMLGISPELYTPVFAMARITGWCAHRMEELITCGRIMRPGYKALFRRR
ncbi:MAG: citrate synthase, partial [Eubacteriales bacterium]